jgi:hypothetical protein
MSEFATVLMALFSASIFLAHAVDAYRSINGNDGAALDILLFPQRPFFCSLRALAARIAAIGLQNLFQVSLAERE